MHTSAGAAYFPAVAIATAVVDAFVAMLVLVYVRCRGSLNIPGSLVGLRQVVLASLVAFLGLVLQVAVLMSLGMGFFGFVRIVLMHIIVTIPLCGFALLVVELCHWRKGMGRLLSTPLLYFVVASLPLAPLGAYATFVEPYLLTLESVPVSVDSARAGTSTIRIGVLADIQTAGVTDHEHRAFDMVMEQSPDLILIPGDVFQNTRAALKAEMPKLRELFGRLHAPGGVFLVLGHSDSASDMRRMIEGTEVRLLINEIVRTSVRDRSVTIAGLDVRISDGFLRCIRKFESIPGQDDVRILLSHIPDSVLHASRDTRIDLVVAGHTHGGQIQIPFFGPLVTLSDVPRSVAAGGLHEVDGRLVYVSRGIGWEQGMAPRIRFLCRPEISMLELQAD